MPYPSTLEVYSRRGAIQIHVYLYLTFPTYDHHHFCTYSLHSLLFSFSHFSCLFLRSQSWEVGALRLKTELRLDCSENPFHNRLSPSTDWCHGFYDHFWTYWAIRFWFSFLNLAFMFVRHKFVLSTFQCTSNLRLSYFILNEPVLAHGIWAKAVRKFGQQ